MIAARGYVGLLGFDTVPIHARESKLRASEAQYRRNGTNEGSNSRHEALIEFLSIKDGNARAFLGGVNEKTCDANVVSFDQVEKQ